MSQIVLNEMIDYYRKKNNLTMKELGKRLGKSESAISRWISGERSPMVEDLERLSELFNTDVETLVFGGQLQSHVGDIVEIAKKLPLDRQAKVLDYAKFQLVESEREI